MNQLYRNLILAGVLVGTGVFSAYACQTDNAPNAATPHAEPVAAPGPGQPPAAQPGEAAEPQAVQGRVEETIPVDKYTYLRLTQPDGSEVWAAVPKAEVKKGQQVAIANPQLMQQFKSATLDRTFDAIYFGQLAQPGAATHGTSGAMPPGHPGVDPQGASAAPNPHGTNPSAGDAAGIEIGQVAKATGPGAYTIAELFAAKATVSGKKVRVRGVVVKAVANVMNRSFLHLRDGSGDAKAGTHDLTVTLAVDPPALGTTVMVEGQATIDRDFGAGYTYPLLIEDAQLVNE